jgi:hypothetical protein
MDLFIQTNRHRQSLRTRIREPLPQFLILRARWLGDGNVGVVHSRALLPLSALGAEAPTVEELRRENRTAPHGGEALSVLRCR